MSYRKAVMWIANNDPTESAWCRMVADLFHKKPSEVADDVSRYRQNRDDLFEELGAGSSAQQGPKVRWTTYNHRFEKGRTKDGYAVCTLCDTHENEAGIIELCPKGPVGQMVVALREEINTLKKGLIE